VTGAGLDRSRAWDDSPAALLVLDEDGAVLDANRTFLRWTGRSAAELAGRLRLADLLSVGGRIYWETHLAPLLRMQGRVDEVAVELRGTDGRLPVLLSAVVHEGRVDVVLSGAQERSRYERELLAARHAAESSAQRVRALQRTTAAFSQASGVHGVVQALRATAVEHLGAAGADVWLVGPHGRLVRSGAAAPDVPPARPPDDASSAVEPDGSAVVALRGSSRWHGVARLRPRTGPAVDPWDLPVLTAVGQQAGLALDRALLFDQSASVAHELQRALLTTHVPSDDRLGVATEYRPGVQSLEVGGDWYDAFTVGDDLVAVVVGDVVGRGLQAAASMGQLRSAVRAAAGPGVGPAEVLSQVDRFVARTGVGFMATMVYAEVDSATGRVRYAAAGHPPPLRLAADGAATFLWDGRSTPLGAPVAARARTDAVVDLDRGDRLLLYTDGLVERRDRPLADGLDVLAASARGVLDGSGSVAALVEQAAVHRGDDRDDICVLLATWRGPTVGPGVVEG